MTLRIRTSVMALALGVPLVLTAVPAAADHVPDGTPVTLVGSL